MTEPFHYKPLKELIKEWENDPAKKKMLQDARDKFFNDMVNVQPMSDLVITDLLMPKTDK